MAPRTVAIVGVTFFTLIVPPSLKMSSHALKMKFVSMVNAFHGHVAASSVILFIVPTVVLKIVGYNFRTVS